MEIILKYSKDGIHWSEGVAQSGPVGDRTTAFYNPFTQNGLLVYGRGVKQTDALEAIWKMKIQRWQLAWRIHWLKE